MKKLAVCLSTLLALHTLGMEVEQKIEKEPDRAPAELFEDLRKLQKGDPPSADRFAVGKDPQLLKNEQLSLENKIKDIIAKAKAPIGDGETHIGLNFCYHQMLLSNEHKDVFNLIFEPNNLRRFVYMKNIEDD